jgi:hypothetical protein
MGVKGWGSAKDVILKGLWTFLSVAEEIGEKNGSEDPPLHGAEKEARSKPRGVSRG